MKRYLLDTNIVSSLMRRPPASLLERLRDVGEGAIYTSIIVAAELRFGAAWRGAKRLASEVDEMLGRLSIVAFEAPVDRVYGEVRADLDRRGLPIGRMDLLIAAQALHDGSVLVTDNTREFERVRGLTVENWLR